jgi:endonuclease/exonuclease/phosphatase family metal-dependent hydrolase
MNPRSSRTFLTLLSLALLSLALPAVADAQKRKKPVKLSVMTRNIYLGGNIAKPLGATTPEEFARLNGEVWTTVENTNFRARARLLAREIRRTRPDLIGLQEVALWRRSPDGFSDGSQTKANIVVYDFLRILRRALKARGLKYRLGSVQSEADVEGPTDRGYDVRLTMRDVILVKRKKGLRVRRKGGKNFKSAISLTTVAGPVTVKRGYTFVDAVYKRRKFRFVDTHLESFTDSHRLDQAEELVGRNGPTRVRKPVILVGDMNSDRNNADSADPAAYNAIRDAGFRDAWITIRGRNAKGYACCLDREDLLDPPPGPFDHRIDHIFTKPKIGGTRARIVGTDPDNRTSSGLWPSDHGGWVATLRLR